MKQSFLLLLTSCLLSCILSSYGQSASSVNIGDDVASVLNNLGQAKGSIDMGSKKIFLYPNGRVTFEADKVVKLDLMSAAETEQALAQKESARLAYLEAKEIRQAQLVERGLSLKDEKLKDPTFLNSPTSHQLFFWENFIRFYPDVDINDIYLSLKAIRSEELTREAAARQAARIAALEQQVAQAEAAKRRAELRAKRRRSYHNYSYKPYVVYNTCPTVIQQHKHKQTSGVTIKYTDKRWSLGYSSGNSVYTGLNGSVCSPQSRNPIVVVHR